MGEFSSTAATVRPGIPEFAGLPVRDRPASRRQTPVACGREGSEKGFWALKSHGNQEGLACLAFLPGGKVGRAGGPETPNTTRRTARELRATGLSPGSSYLGRMVGDCQIKNAHFMSAAQPLLQPGAIRAYLRQSCLVPWVEVRYLGLMSIRSDVVTEADLLDQLVTDGQWGISTEAARAILSLRFSTDVVGRMNELAERNRQGTLSLADRATLENFLRLGQFLNVMQAKARLCLAGTPEAGN